MAEHLPEADERQKVLQEALELAQSIEDADFRARALTNVASHFVDLDASNLLEVILDDWLGTLQDIDRPESLRLTIQTIDLFASLGGTDTLVEIAESINVVGQWWP